MKVWRRCCSDAAGIFGRVALLSFLFSPAALSQSQDLSGDEGLAAAISFSNTVRVQFNNSVEGDCLPVPSAIEQAAKVRLLERHFDVVDASSVENVPVLVITAAGGRSAEQCVVNFEVILHIYIEGDRYLIKQQSPMQLGVYEHAYYELRHTDLIDPTGASMQKRLEVLTRESVDNLYLEAELGRARLKGR